MKINNTASQQNFTGLIINSSGISYIKRSNLSSILKLRERMDKLKYFDLEISEKGPAIRLKDKGIKFFNDFTVSPNEYPTNNEVFVNTTMQQGFTKQDITLYLQYRNREEARKAYKGFKSNDTLGKAIDLIEKLEYETEKKNKQLKREKIFFI